MRGKTVTRHRLTALGFGMTALVMMAVGKTAGRFDRAAPEITESWYPLQPGNTWTYQKESLEGDMAHPDFERWITEETVLSTVSESELPGTLITERTRVLSDFLTKNFLPANDSAKREEPESYLLIYRDCVYALGGTQMSNDHHLLSAYRNELVGGKIPAEYCFPMAKGITWGKVPNTSPAEEFVWLVTGVNADAFGQPGGRTFHMSARAGSGELIDRWFEEGVGLLQEVDEHHGTYDEGRQQLLKATIRGRAHVYRLTPARTVPMSKWDCDGPGWRHFARADGSSFKSVAACMSYALRRK